MVTAQFLAEVGDGVSLVALPLYVFAETGSEVWTSITFGVELALGIVLSLVGGLLADWFDRQLVLRVSYLVRGILLVLAFAVDPLLLAVAFGVSARALGNADNPSFDALVPDQADGDLQQVVAIRRFIQAVSFTIGPGIGSLAVWLVGPRPALLINAVTFVVAFFVLSLVKDLDPGSAGRSSARHGVPFRESFVEVVSGMGVGLRTPGIRRLLLNTTLASTTVGLVIASALVFYERDLGVADYWFGLAISGYGIGSAVGLVIAGSRQISWPLPRLMLVAAPIYGVACGIGSLVDWPALLAISWFLWGIAYGPELVQSELFFVSRIEEAERGRAFAAHGVAAALGMAMGSFLAAPLLYQFSARTVILGAGVSAALIGLLWIGPAIQGSRWPDSD